MSGAECAAATEGRAEYTRRARTSYDTFSPVGLAKSLSVLVPKKQKFAWDAADIGAKPSLQDIEDRVEVLKGILKFAPKAFPKQNLLVLTFKEMNRGNHKICNTDEDIDEWAAAASGNWRALLKYLVELKDAKLSSGASSGNSIVDELLDSITREVATPKVKVKAKGAQVRQRLVT